MNYLRFVNRGDLEYDVCEMLRVRMNIPRNDGSFEQVVHLTKAWAGALRFGTGVQAGWHFFSSDSSVHWFLGSNLKRAQAELRRRYADGQRKGAKGDRRRASARRRNTNGDRARVRTKGRNARRIP